MDKFLALQFLHLQLFLNKCKKLLDKKTKIMYNIKSEVK